MQAAGVCLQNFCTKYNKTDFSSAQKRLCLPAHGLYCLAEILLDEESFACIKMPEAKNFNLNFALWRMKNRKPRLNVYIEHGGDLRIFDEIYLCEAARSIISQPYLYRDNPFLKHARKQWYPDEKEVTTKEFARAVAGL